MALTNKLSAIGEAIREKTGKSELLTLDAMPEEIRSIEGSGGGGIPDDLINYTGVCSYKFSYGTWDWIINNYGDKITTSELTNTMSMFYRNKTIKSIPFTFNYSASSSVNLNDMFEECEQLEYIGDINFRAGLANGSQDIFLGCYKLKQIPNMTNWYVSTSNGSRMYQVFANCRSLRVVPDFVGNYYSGSKETWTGSSSVYQGAFNYCYSLDEITCMPFYKGKITSNSMSSVVYRCGRLKRFLFKYEDGTIPSAQWKNQTLDLSSVGFIQETTINWHNSGITASTQVIDDETYQALKDNPDWWSSNVAYSRYNHNSAVETINNLPDASVYLATAGGINTIKFKGGAGSLTDGGAINTLTEEEIAVATAKGWTVSLV